MLSLSTSDIKRHTRSHLPVVPYAPTANGFFATDGRRGEGCNTERGRSRLQAAKALAKELGVSQNQIALAWLLHQPFPVYPILGTSDPGHLTDALGAVEVSLTTEQVRALAC